MLTHYSKFGYKYSHVPNWHRIQNWKEKLLQTKYKLQIVIKIKCDSYPASLIASILWVSYFSVLLKTPFSLLYNRLFAALAAPYSIGEIILLIPLNWPNRPVARMKFTVFLINFLSVRKSLLSLIYSLPVYCSRRSARSSHSSMICRTVCFSWLQLHHGSSALLILWRYPRMFLSLALNNSPKFRLVRRVGADLL